jgi:glycosyltransferase involved in cell wall biosynthesis
VLIVSDNISMRMGGEASLPFYYAKLFLRRGVDVWLGCHERVEKELVAAFPELRSQIRVAQDTRVQKNLWRWSSMLPYRMRDLLLDQVIRFSTQRRLRKIAIELARSGKIDVVFEPAPITPKGLSLMYNLGVPVVIGPMCGGINFPPAFADLDSLATRSALVLSRRVSQLFHKLVPGKLNADVLLAANASTVKALPTGYRGRVIMIFESGVDLGLWNRSDAVANRHDGTVHFAFSGRFVDWKGIQYLVPAFAKAVAQEPCCRLDLIGGGELEGEVRATIEHYRLAKSVHLHGWISRPDAARIIGQADVFVMPSLRECGGTAILEAMALGKPVIATNWGGPADYVNASCGLLIDPSSKSDFINGLAEAMVQLARSPNIRRQLGEGGKLRVRRDNLDWDAKADRILSILGEVTR